MFDNIGWIQTLLFVVYIIDIIMALMIVFLERKNPSATLAWIMVLFLIPIGGIILYLLFAQNIARKKLFRLTKYERQVIEEELIDQIDEVRHDRFFYGKKNIAEWKDLILLNQNYSSSYLTQGNDISILTDGRHMFDSLLADIAMARESINIQFFIVKNDSAGRRLVEALTAKAKEGVEVRFLLDALGSRRMTPAVLADFMAAGGKAAYFFPPKFKYLNFRFNYRDHRKIAVIDGWTGYLGGFNVGNEYLGKKPKFGYWRDTHLRLSGNCIRDINARFLLDWRLASHENITIDYDFRGAVPATEGAAIQIVSSGPDTARQEVKHAYLKMMTSAKKSIYIQSPYFIPDVSILESLVNAAESGVDVRIMIPRMPDHMFVYWGTYYYCGLLLRSGVRVFIYDKGFLHAKTMSVDGEVCSVGSANFDTRSFKLSFETNAFIFDDEKAFELEAIFEEDMAECHELTRALYAQRSYWIRLKEGIAKLLSDIL
ncbi:MAG: cardiolipin synthase [Clostridiales Family XIII bacterium]|jgi:cardiolipin synthase|nr:cardiolipin synthase [Clostridiales Family XIII bacterium]